MDGLAFTAEIAVDIDGQNQQTQQAIVEDLGFAQSEYQGQRNNQMSDRKIISSLNLCALFTSMGYTCMK